MYDNVIATYTRQQAIEDGIFTDITEVAKDIGFKYPVAVTTNLYGSHILTTTDGNCDKELTSKKLISVLKALKEAIAKQTEPDSFIAFDISGELEAIKAWAVIEAQSPTDPSPAINIMLPEDY